MKKIFLSLLITFALLILSNVEGKGQACSCPTGYSTVSFDYEYNSSCTLTINLCVMCHPTGHPEIRLCGVTFDYGNSKCDQITIDPNFWAEIRKQSVLHVNGNLCNIGVGPCPQLATYEYYNGMCKEIINDTFNDLIYIRNCDGEAGLCISESYLCWNGSELIYTANPPHYVDDGDCDSPTEPIEIDFTDLNNLYEGCFKTCP